MEPITATVIVSALAAGASSGVIDALKDDMKDKAKAAYAKLRKMVGLKVAGHKSAEAALAGHDANPETFRVPLTKTLSELNIAADPEIVSATQALMQLIDQASPQVGKNIANITNSKGVMIGDHGFQVNSFTD